MSDIGPGVLCWVRREDVRPEWIGRVVEAIDHPYRIANGEVMVPIQADWLPSPAPFRWQINIIGLVPINPRGDADALLRDEPHEVSA